MLGAMTSKQKKNQNKIFRLLLSCENLKFDLFKLFVISYYDKLQIKIQRKCDSFIKSIKI